jgi:hypothetical protein
MTTQSVQFTTYDFGAALSPVTLRDPDTDTLVTTADSCTEISVGAAVYVAVFDEVAVIPAGVYRLRAVIDGVPLNRFVTLAGVDGELVYARVERAAELDSASLIRFITEDTGETTAADGSVAKLSQGGTGVTVLPAVGISADRSPGVTLQAFVGETITQSITLYETDGTTPIVLSGKTLAIVFETRQGGDVATISNSNITVSGTSDNVVTFAYPSASTAAQRVLKFALRDAIAPKTVYLQGLLNVTRAPSVDPAP